MESNTDFPTNFPTENEKIWKVTLSRTQDIRIHIQCNNIELVNIVLSDTTCDTSGWRTNWNGNVKKIMFMAKDKGSKYYKPGEYR